MLRVLIVEDERNIRFLISSVLTPVGYDVVEATNGLEALLQLAQTADIGLIISDVRMPELDGIDLTEEVKRVYPNIPVIIISAFADDALEAVERGADYFIVKPFTRDQLLAIVRTAAQTEPRPPDRQRFVGRIHSLLHREIPDGQVFLSPVTVNLDQQTVLEPDVTWVAANSHCIVTEKYVQGAPDLIVEVPTTGTSQRDKREKFELYERYGVREYWLFDMEGKCAEVWVHDGERFERLGIFGTGKPFTSSALGKLVDLSPIFD